MMLLTKEIERKIPALYSQENNTADATPVIVKFFDPAGNWTWYVLEGERLDDGDWRFYGLVDGFEKELGYFTLNELVHAKDGLRGLQALPIERDMYFSGKTLADVQATK